MKNLLSFLLIICISANAYSQPTSAQYKADTLKSNSRIRLLEWQSKRDSTNISVLQSQVSAMAKSIADLQKPFIIDSSFGTVTIGKVADSLKANTWRLTLLQTQYTGIAKDVTALKNTPPVDLTPINTKVAGLETRVTAVEARKIPTAATLTFQY